VTSDSKTVAGRAGALGRALSAVAGATLMLFAVCCPFAARLGPVATWGAALVGLALLVAAAPGARRLGRKLGLRSRARLSRAGWRCRR
jgi:hypothetical protein